MPHGSETPGTQSVVQQPIAGYLKDLSGPKKIDRLAYQQMVYQRTLTVIPFTGFSGGLQDVRCEALQNVVAVLFSDA